MGQIKGRNFWKSGKNLQYEYEKRPFYLYKGVTRLRMNVELSIVSLIVYLAS